MQRSYFRLLPEQLILQILMFGLACAAHGWQVREEYEQSMRKAGSTRQDESQPVH